MGSFQYEWWLVDVIINGTRMALEVKARNKENAIKQIEKMANPEKAKDFFEEITAKQLTEGKIFWETLRLDRKGYQRLF